MSPSRPKISIVMPNYNHSHELEQSLKAITEQTRPADEIVIVNDGSTDNSLEVISGFATQFPSIRILDNSSRLGVVAAVNRGLREATGDYVILASADERIMPEMCQEMEAALATCPQAQLIVARFTEWYPQTGKLQHGDHNECDLWFLKNNQPAWITPEMFRKLLDHNHVRLSVNSAMFKRDSLLEVGLFDPDLKWHSDWFAIYATALRHGFYALPQTLSWYRISEASYSVSGSSSKEEQQRVVKYLLQKLATAEFSDVGEALYNSPSAMSPFIRSLLVTLLRQPKHYSILARILSWWIREFTRGNRPKIWARTPIGKMLRSRSNVSKLAI